MPAQKKSPPRCGCEKFCTLRPMSKYQYGDRVLVKSRSMAPAIYMDRSISPGTGKVLGHYVVCEGINDALPGTNVAFVLVDDADLMMDDGRTTQTQPQLF